MRRAELIALTYDRLDEGALTLRVLGKRNKERIIPVRQEIMDACMSLKALRKQDKINSKHVFTLKRQHYIQRKFACSESRAKTIS